ncbi:TetR family transcriptional regulator [Sinomonas sp. ASV322]|uniref:TetR/AcrR family transcriptional regulator n=1 Tax=Sinomonas sp. ASV322 TaxID=3041920 RepID=UPI0027DC3081|nr:TetR family transcriptional regulator [Sinomonas sp. ASV322]MDQ4503020.1 TetR family transcriptional regulator [Sinomonas sp. ASV322]
MAWDTERTRALLLAAGATEFSQHGLAGGRVDRIAAEAGVNKERIYQYFGNKQGLFDAVVVSELGRVMDAVPIQGTGVDAVTDYAGRLFDYHLARPDLARLVFWEGLERGEGAVALAERAQRSRDKAAAVQGMLPGVTAAAAAELLLTIVTLCDAWPTIPQLDRLITGGGEGRAQARRAAVVRLARLAAEDALAGVQGGS